MCVGGRCCGQGALHTTLPGRPCGTRADVTKQQVSPVIAGGWLPLPGVFPCGLKAAWVPAQVSGGQVSTCEGL